jgi:hypothetical protein
VAERKQYDRINFDSESGAKLRRLTEAHSKHIGIPIDPDDFVMWAVNEVVNQNAHLQEGVDAVSGSN